VTDQYDQQIARQCVAGWNPWGDDEPRVSAETRLALKALRTESYDVPGRATVWHRWFGRRKTVDSVGN
jgi:hypothetical protein